MKVIMFCCVAIHSLVLIVRHLIVCIVIFRFLYSTSTSRIHNVQCIYGSN